MASRVAESVSQGVWGFGWSRILKNTRSRIFSSDSGSPIESFITSHSYVRNPDSCLLKWYNFFWNLLLMKPIILAVHHDFHWLVFATKLLIAKLHSRYMKKSVSGNFGSEESELETNILPPTPQPCQGKEILIHNLFGEMKAFEAKLIFW